MSNKEIRKDQNKAVFFGQLEKGQKIKVGMEPPSVKVFAHADHPWDSFGSGTGYNLVGHTIYAIEDVTEEKGFTVITTADAMVFCKEEDNNVFYGVILEDPEPKKAITIVGLYTNEFYRKPVKTDKGEIYHDYTLRSYIKHFVPDYVDSTYADKKMYVIKYCDITYCCMRVYPIQI